MVCIQLFSLDRSVWFVSEALQSEQYFNLLRIRSDIYRASLYGLIILHADKRVMLNVMFCLTYSKPF